MSTPDPAISFDEASDREWARAGDELDYGTELLVEWGVRFSGGTSGDHVSLYGDGDDMEADARAFAASVDPQADRTVTVVARRVLYGPWGERDA